MTSGRSGRWLAALALTATTSLGTLTGCGGDDDQPPPAGAGGQAPHGGSGGKGGSGNRGGEGNAAEGGSGAIEGGTNQGGSGAKGGHGGSGAKGGHGGSGAKGGHGGSGAKGGSGAVGGSDGGESGDAGAHGGEEHACDDVTCSDHGTCSVAAGHPVCTCAAGYAPDPADPTLCVDVDECLTLNGGCDQLTTCTNLPGSRACGACPPTYTGTGETTCSPKLCDGAPGADCACLKVSYQGDDAAAVATHGLLPFRDVQPAIDFADANRDIATKVCVERNTTCDEVGAHAFDADGLEMKNAISVYGNYESTGWTRCDLSASFISGLSRVSFGADIHSETVLDGFDLDGTVSADGALGARLESLRVHGSGDDTEHLAVVAVNGARLSLASSKVWANSHAARAVGVSVKGARVAIDDTVIYGEGTGYVTGIELDTAGGSSIENTAVRLTGAGGNLAQTHATGVALRIVGSSEGTLVSSNDFSVVGPLYAVTGISAESCAGAFTLSDNVVAANNPTSGYVPGQPDALGVNIAGDCEVRVEGNVITSTGGFDINDVAMACQGPCTIADNVVYVDKSGSTPGGTQGAAVGLTCTGCREISDNSVTGLILPSGLLRSTVYSSTGLVVSSTSSNRTLVARNSVSAGCSQTCVGATAGGARLENNVIEGRAGDATCLGDQGTYPAVSSIGLVANGNVDVHSNYIASRNVSDLGQRSSALVVQGTGATIRNNALAGSRYSVEAGSWAVFENNAFAGPVMAAPSDADTADEVNALPNAAHNLAGSCYEYPGYHLSAGSACIDAGTTTGAPLDDIDREARDEHPDVGVDEWSRAGDPCFEVTCSGHGTCDVVGSSAQCLCSPGYKLDPNDPLACVVDACFQNGGCDPRVTCTPAEGGGRVCGPCPSGYTGDGEVACVDIDECATDNGGCDPLSVCTNSPGTYVCGPCPPGYVGSGWTECVLSPYCDPNPCTHGATCYGTESDYSCGCSPGNMGLNCDLTFTQMDGGPYVFCGVRNDGTLRCWGRNVGGESSPPSGTFTQSSSGDSFSCALRTDGTIACWGNNGYGQATPPAGTFLSVSAGSTHACAVRDDHVLVCWGDDTSGEATVPNGTFLAVAAGAHFTCAVKSDGALACWGAANAGRTQPPGGAFETVNVAQNFGCALAAGSITCWGDGSTGGLNVPSGSFTSFTLGAASGIGIRTDGSVARWGLGGTAYRTGNYTAVAADTSAECAVRAANGTVQCWGSGSAGETTPPSGAP